MPRTLGISPLDKIGLGPPSRSLLQIAVPSLWTSHTGRFTPVESSALREAAFAVVALLGGCRIKTLSIDADGGATREYVIGNAAPCVSHLVARCHFAAPIMCSLVDCPLPQTTRDMYFLEAKAALRRDYPNEGEMLKFAAHFWRKALSLLQDPREFRTAAALAAHLIRERHLHAVPARCVSSDRTPIPELAAAATQMESEFFQIQWEVATA